jgi:uncharacterized RDD family membrane protein YckC
MTSQQAMQATQETLLGQYAGFVTRMIAFAIDQLIVGFVISVVVVIAEFVTSAFGVNEWFGTGDLARTIVTTLVIGTSALVFILYDLLFWMLAGQTPGKRFLGVRIVRTDGRRLSWGNAIRRKVGYWISAVLFLGYLWVIIDNRRQAWHDHLAGTLVLYSWPEQGGTPVTKRLQRFRERRQAAAGAKANRVESSG